MGVELDTLAGGHTRYIVWAVCDACGVAGVACGGPRASVPDGVVSSRLHALGAWFEGMRAHHAGEGLKVAP